VSDDHERRALPLPPPVVVAIVAGVAMLRRLMLPSPRPGCLPQRLRHAADRRRAAVGPVVTPWSVLVVPAITAVTFLAARRLTVCSVRAAG
jgi:hypothetical protein